MSRAAVAAFLVGQRTDATNATDHRAAPASSH
jgi:hypothetical protein